ncbi:MAG TPA: DUF4190 domain-containing protein [Armatimonadota bacterium]|jgi:hypothetical protein
MNQSWDEARAYVEQARGAGHSAEEIAAGLRAAGWSEEEVQRLAGPPPTCPYTPPSPASGFQMHEEPPPPPAGEGMARAALILGIISFFLFPLSLILGPLAVILGGISLSRRRSGQVQAIVGMILALLGWVAMIIVLPILTAILFPVAARARDKAQETTCLSHVRQLSVALGMYATEYDEHFPPADLWVAKVKPYVTDSGTYLCPSDRRADLQALQGQNTSYTMSMAAGGARRGAGADPASRGVLYDGTVLAGGREAAALRHHGGLNVGFEDGHVKWLGPSNWESVPLGS